MHRETALRRMVKRASRSVKGILTCGLTPKKLSLTLCLGVATGVMPLLWGTTLLCAGLASLFRLNQGVIQAVNYCCYPLQLALLFPLYRLGQTLFPWGPSVTSEVLRQALHGNLGASAGVLAWATLKALGAWLVTIVPLAVLSYPVLKIVLAKKGAARAGSYPAEAAAPCVVVEESRN